ncbi:DNA polymerase III subunit gamma/tau [Sulfurirhabdus autotrophica]|uniref:DNA polymerase III subunit gamma/tau n=1 Tax=Sulfurirhabdus autotrophica TaxID=1706046 RepID=A0A4R3XUT1_9PROT|nr:DNA polymerase III subunit gamma/tau [Sulfurirhabdus autotrophica]TCV79116.1 DNA polymerase-3 subunit gamma/tau [Sulfurirhabdus autotrophica]
MSYQVLARKWRPKSFTELVGQEHVVKALSNALEQQRLHHAYLFTGTRGVGKTTIARILSKSLNCETGITVTPCGQCSACREIDSGRFVDLLELDAASNTGIDNMREVLDNAQYAPTSGRFKVYIIDEVHMLSKAAFNSMLKTLEEPPEHVKFILATTDPQKIPVTVLSRCLQFNLKQMPPLLIVGHLQRILGEEGIQFDLPSMQLVARAAQGSMRDALSLLDQAIAYGGGVVEEQGVRSMLGAIDQSYLFTLLKALSENDGAGMLATAQQMAVRSLSFDAALQDLGMLLHQIALAQTIQEAIAEDLPERDQIIELAQIFKPEAIQLYYQIVLHGRKELGLAPDELVGFNMTLLRMLAFTPEYSVVPVRTLSVSSSQNVEPAMKPFSAPSAGAVAVIKAEAKEIEAPSELSVEPDAPQNEAVKKSQFDGNWHNLVNILNLGGMARMLAQHCELKRQDGNIWELCVPQEHKHLLERAYQERLKTAVNEYLGSPQIIQINIGEVVGLTPAQLNNQEKQERQSEAIASIEQDPFVRELVENFDAKVVESSIKPIQ